VKKGKKSILVIGMFGFVKIVALLQKNIYDNLKEAEEDGRRFFG